MISRFYRSQSSSIVSEIIDGEAIILDLRSGVYFSARDSAAVIWDGLIAGFPIDAIATRLAACFDTAFRDVDAAISDMVALLTAHHLIAPAQQCSDTPAVWSLELPAQKHPFKTPVLEAYGDLQDLAQLDPIHDVEPETGWPNRRTDLPNG